MVRQKEHWRPPGGARVASKIDLTLGGQGGRRSHSKVPRPHLGQRLRQQASAAGLSGPPVGRSSAARCIDIQFSLSENSWECSIDDKENLPSLDRPPPGLSDRIIRPESTRDKGLAKILGRVCLTGCGFRW